jgi:hypothetical protein
MSKLFYFGTDLYQAGHYFFKFEGDGKRDLGLTFPKGVGISLERHKEWPFDPERFTESKGLKIGEATYGRIGTEYTICGFNGSCADSRPGSKSVFFVEGLVEFKDMQGLIESFPAAKEIIDAMKFPINWGNKIPEEPVAMLSEKSWEEFRKTGLILFINSFLHIFGWALTLEFDKENILRVYPARTKFRGFDSKSTQAAHKMLSTYLKENAEELEKEAHS